MAKEKEILRLRSLGMSQKAIMSVVHCASRKIKSDARIKTGLVKWKN